MNESIYVNVINQQYVLIIVIRAHFAVVPISPKPRPPTHPTPANRSIPLRARRVISERIVLRPVRQVPTAPPANITIPLRQRVRKPDKPPLLLLRVMPPVPDFMDDANLNVAPLIEPCQVIPQARQPHVVLHQPVSDRQFAAGTKPDAQVEAANTEHVILRGNRHPLALRHPRQRAKPPLSCAVVRPRIVTSQYHNYQLQTINYKSAYSRFASKHGHAFAAKLR